MDIPTLTGPILALDIGGAFTRAFLFDYIKDHYQLVGTGKTNTTLGKFGSNIRHGVRMALEQLQANTGRILINAHKDLIQPGSPEGNGVNQCVVTISAGPPIKIFLIGMAKDPILGKIELLIKSTYFSQLQIYRLDERLKPETILDDILRSRPDLIVVSGGMNGSGPQSLSQVIEPIRLTFLRLPSVYRPEILFLGGQELQMQISSYFHQSQNIHYAPDFWLDRSTEKLELARSSLSAVIVKIRSRQLPGLPDLIRWSQGNSLTSTAAFGRIIRFINQIHGNKKSIVGIDYGVSGVTIAGAVGGKLSQTAYNGFCSSSVMNENFDPESIKPLSDWIIEPGFSHVDALEYLYNKSIYPTSVPLTNRDTDLQEAITRFAIRSALIDILSNNLANNGLSKDGFLTPAEPILASGGIFSAGTHPARLCLLLLDSIQPKGITTLVLDSQQVAVPLGALAALNPDAATQIIDSNLFLHLATVISPTGNAPIGTPILRVRMTLDDGAVKTMDIKQGEIDVMPLSPGLTARLQLQPFQRSDIGMGGAGRAGTLRVVGSLLGVVIDGRGRPLKLPDDVYRRKELNRKWLWMLGC